MLNAGDSDSTLSAVPAGVLTSASESSPTSVTVGVVDAGDSPVAGASVGLALDGVHYPLFTSSGSTYSGTTPLAARGGDSLDMVLYMCPEAVTGSSPITPTLCPVLETQSLPVTYTATTAVTAPAMVSDTVVDVTVYDQNGLVILDPAATVTLTPSGGSAGACTLDTYYGTYGCRTGSNAEGYITASLSVTPASASAVTVPTSLSVYSEGTPFSRAVDIEVGGTMPISDSGDAYYEFVSIDGDWMVVGQPDEKNGGYEKAGRALVFKRDGYGWLLHQTLTIPTESLADTSQVFGQATGVSGHWIAVSAPGATLTEPSDSTTYTGWIYLYKLDESSDTWELTDTVHSWSIYGWFGHNMVLVGDTLVTGSAQYFGIGQGAVVVYTRDGDTWGVSQTLTLDDDNWKSHGVGGYVGFDGSTIVSLCSCANSFSCPYYSTESVPYMQVWELDGSGVFVMQDAIVAPYAYTRAPRVSGDWMAIGQYQQESDTGVVQMYHKEGGEWVSGQTITGVDTKYFGKALALDGDYMVVGAPNHGGDDLYGRVAVYHLFRGASEWVETQAVVGTQYQQQIGYSVGLDASTGMLVAGNQNEEQALYVGGFPSGASPHVLTMSTGPVADITSVPVVELDTTEILAKVAATDGTFFGSGSVSFFFSDDETETPTAMAYSAGDEGFSITAIPADTFSLGDSLMIQAYVPTPLPADTEHFTFDVSTGEATVETEPLPCGVSAAPLYKEAMDLCLSLLDEEDVAQSGLLLETSVKWKLKGADDSTYHTATWSAAEGAYTAESPVTDGWAGAAIDITVSYGGIKEYEVSVAVFEEPASTTSVITPSSLTADAGTAIPVTITLKDQYSNTVQADCQLSLVTDYGETDISSGSGTAHSPVSLSDAYLSTFSITATRSAVTSVRVMSQCPWESSASLLTSIPITVTPGVAVQAESSLTVADSVVAGAAISTTSEFRDTYKNLVTPSSVKIQFGTGGSEETAVLDTPTSTYSTSTTAVTQAGTTSVIQVVSSPHAAAASQKDVTVTHAAPDQANTTVTPTSAVAGAGVSVTVTSADQYSNAVSSASCHLGFGSAVAATTEATYNSGSYSAIVQAATTAGDADLYMVWNKGLSTEAVHTKTVTITGGAVSAFTVSDPATIELDIPSAVVFTLQDSYGNAAAMVESSSEVWATIVSISSTPVVASYSADTDSYSATFTGTTLGAVTLTVEVDDGANTWGPYAGDGTVTVVPAGPSAPHSTLTVPTGVVAGNAFSLTLALADRDGISYADQMAVSALFTSGATSVSIDATYDSTLSLYTIATTSAIHNLATTFDITVTCGANTSFKTDTVTIVPAAPASAESTYTVPTTSQMAGSSWPVSVSLYDEYQNECRTGNVSVEAVYTQGSVSTSVTLSQVTGLNVYTAPSPSQARTTSGVWAVSITVDGEASFLSGKSVTVTPGAPYAFYTSNTLSVPSSDVTAGDGFTVTLTPTDVYSNIVTDATSVVGVFSVVGTDESITATYNSSTNLYTIASTTAIDTVANTYSLSINVGSTTGFITGQSVTVVADVPVTSESTYTVPTISQVAGTDWGVTLALHDAYGNEYTPLKPAAAVYTMGSVSRTETLTQTTALHEYTADAPTSVSTAAGVWAVSITVDGETSFLSGKSVTVVAADPYDMESNLTLPFMEDIVAGTPIPITADIMDQYSNPITSDLTVSVAFTATGVSTVTIPLVFSTTTYGYSATTTPSIHETAGEWSATLNFPGNSGFLGGGPAFTVVPATPYGPTSTMTVPTAAVEAGTAFDVTLTLQDQYGNLVTEEKAVSVTYTAASTPVTLTAVYNASTYVYTVTSTDAVHNTAGTYTVVSEVAGDSAFLSDSVTVNAAATDPETTTVTTTTRTRRRRTTTFTVATTDSYGNSTTESSVSSTKSLPDSITIRVSGDGWSSSGPGVLDSSGDFYTADVYLTGSGTAVVYLSIDGVEAEKMTIDVSVSYLFIVVVVIACILLVVLAILTCCFWGLIRRVLRRDDLQPLDKKSESTVQMLPSPTMVLEAVPMHMAVEPMPVEGGSIYAPYPVMVQPEPVLPVKQEDSLPTLFAHTRSTVPLMQQNGSIPEQSESSSDGFAMPELQHVAVEMSDDDGTHSDSLSITDPDHDNLV
ncbi:hypothetical protein KIPB_002902 [Kipferlia bialata]|uniref:Ig-like domain-containing protein n=1 Tax=Kipferlia bialata TaxID=797122 RepID=A0A9K3GGJ8_9EUKA|nr:hypothetical protein KIPB_002902 [Kipferlia bialata]|eukprot:g2902.t1